jgi:hypothetical protein
MPWVEVRITGRDGVSVSVGNFSSGEKKAAIKSFQFGISNGNGCTIEVLDEEGGEFSTFYEKISTGNLDSGTRSFVLEFEFGWATMSCEDGGSTLNQQHCCPTGPLEPTFAGFGVPGIGSPGFNPFNGLTGGGIGAFDSPIAVSVRPSGVRQGLRSCRHTMTVRNIICNVANGVFKYSIEGADMTTDMFSTRSPETFGRDTVGGEMYLTDAIRSLFREFNVDVDFYRLEGTCRPEAMRWRVTRPGPSPDLQATRGPLGRWSALNRNPIQASRAWLSEHLTDRNKGIVTFWDTTKLFRPRLIFLEANDLSCSDVRDTLQFHVGTYIVNGGACSPVLSFTPQLEYVPNSLGVGTGGAGGGATMPTMFRETGPEPCLRGSPSMRFQGYHNPGFVETHTAFTSYGRDGIREASDAKLIHARANLYANRGITAELRVQGDPTFDTPLLMHGHYVSIVYINPFRVKPIKLNGKDYCDWVSRSSCSNMLSNSNYMITGVSHEIKEGHFSTTLKLRLATPGIDIGRDLPIGGMPGGPTIPRT